MAINGSVMILYPLKKRHVSVTITKTASTIAVEAVFIINQWAADNAYASSAFLPLAFATTSSSIFFGACA